jgi:hypothetical protein
MSMLGFEEDPFEVHLEHSPEISVTKREDIAVGPSMELNLDDSLAPIENPKPAPKIEDLSV